MKQFTKGQQVYDPFNGWGVIREIKHGTTYCIIVDFLNNTEYYTLDGKSFREHEIPSLYHDKVEIG